MLNVVFIGRQIIITHFIIDCFANKGHDSSTLNLRLLEILLKVAL